VSTREGGVLCEGGAGPATGCCSPALFVHSPGTVVQCVSVSRVSTPPGLALRGGAARTAGSRVRWAGYARECPVRGGGGSASLLLLSCLAPHFRSCDAGVRECVHRTRPCRTCAARHGGSTRKAYVLWVERMREHPARGGERSAGSLLLSVRVATKLSPARLPRVRLLLCRASL
jgi:hypothetical protein